MAGLAAAILLIVSPTRASATPPTVDTLLSVEQLGAVAVDPSGRWLVVERRLAQQDWPSFDLGYQVAEHYGEIFVAPADRPEDLAPLLRDPTAGFALVGFSPSGGVALVERLTGRELRLGFVDLATGDGFWTDIAPAPATYGRSLAWDRQGRLLILGTADGELPFALGRTAPARDRLPEMWARQATGASSLTYNAPTGGGSPYGDLILWRFDPTRRLAEALVRGPILDLELSYDGTSAALLFDGGAELGPVQEEVREVRRRRSLGLLDLSTGALIRPDGALDIAASLMAWAPTQRTLLVYDRGEDRFLTISAAGAVSDVNLGDVRPEAIQDETFGLQVSGGWMGGVPVVRGRSPATDRPDLWLAATVGPINLTHDLGAPGTVRGQVSDGVLVMDGEEVVHMTGGATVRLGALSTSSQPPVLGLRRLTDPMHREEVVFTKEGRICRIGSTAPQSCIVADPERGGTVVAIDWLRATLYLVGADAQGVTRLSIGGRGDSPPIITLNGGLEGVRFPEALRVTGPDGSGWLYRPEGDGPWPVVVIPYPDRIYPSPPAEMAAGTDRAFRSGLPLVSAGYAVLYPDLPDVDDPAERIADRILAVVDAAGRQEARLDPDRLVLWGWSFGAWASAMAATQTDRFDAVAALNGPYDPMSIMGSSDLNARVEGRMSDFAIDNARWLETGQMKLAAPFWTNPGSYARASVVARADRLSAPVLLLSGDQDFSMGQAELLYGALTRLDRRPVLITYFGEGHALASPGNLRDMYRRIIAFFDQALAADETAGPSSAAPRAPAT